MARNVLYAALGEEAARGVKESATVGFVPLVSAGIPKSEFDDRRRKEFRGEEASFGDSSVERVSQRWGATLEMPFFTETGSAKGLIGTLLKHFFGRSASVQNGATGQYCHMLSPAADPFSGANLGERALTLNININEGAEVRNWPYVGGRVKGLAFEQEPGQPLNLTAELMGQRRLEPTTEIGSPVFAHEGLRCDFNNLSVYAGAVARSGTAPDFSDLSPSGAAVVRPDKVAVRMENGMEDSLRLSGVDYPDRSRIGRFKVSVEITIDWEDPASGFSSAAEFRSWMASASTTGLLLHWDTGTQAGGGDNHGLFIDLPRLVRTGGEPEYAIDKDPMVTLKYEGLYDPDTTGYMMGLLLKNTVPAV